MSPIFTIETYSHFFLIRHPNIMVTQLLEEYCHKLVHHTLVKKPKIGFVMAPTRVYAARLRDNSEYRFHINQLEDFKKFLRERHVDEKFYEIVAIPLFTPLAIDCKVQDWWQPRDYQVPIIDYVLAEDGNRSKMIQIQTGGGKTGTALYSISKLAMRTVVLIKASYMEKWCSDITSILDVKAKEIMTVSGSAQLKGLIELAMNDELTAKFIIISNRTYQNYIESYEENFGDVYELGYGCPPDKFFEMLRAGILLIDEVHQQFYAMFKTKLYTHIPLSISLSATLVSDDHFIKKVHEICYPVTSRYRQMIADNYIKVYGMCYFFKDVKRIRTSDYGSTIYSHHAFEKSIIKQPEVLRNYIELIEYATKVGYFKDYRPGDRLAVFAASIELCNILTNHFKHKYPKMDVRRYVQDDPYENIIDADIRITTIGSGGTAIDIPNLTCSVLTINILSIQSNLQTLGRLRNIPGRDVNFIYLWAAEIDKHKLYHQRRVEMLESYTRSIVQYEYPKPI
jgi:superfamily II DNA or RNA helicase